MVADYRPTAMVIAFTRSDPNRRLVWLLYLFASDMVRNAGIILCDEILPSIAYLSLRDSSGGIDCTCNRLPLHAEKFYDSTLAAFHQVV